MKKILYLGAALLLFATLNLGAVPARKDPFIVKQPDGSSLLLYAHGDEYFHWLTDASGVVYEQHEDGWYRIGAAISPRAFKGRDTARMLNAARLRRAQLMKSSANIGQKHIPVILVEFKDVAFSIDNPNDAFTALLNEHGYSANGGTGSVRDYYYDNSHGLYEPIFDVFGPVQLPRNMSYYGSNRNSVRGNDMHPEEALYDALSILAEAGTDFSVFDSDGDGNVDMTLFYYAGYNEAEGASANTIWPHQYSLDYSSSQAVSGNSFNGIHFGNYFCTSELQGTSGAEMCGIGTTCHEFAHSLGLPDFYDTDYETNGEAGAVYEYSLMCSGCYNNNSRTPPFLSAEELIMLGWMDENAIQTITEYGVRYTIPAIENWQAAKLLTDNEGEYFLLETRGHQSWDSQVAGGLLIYHVDKSKKWRVGGITPYDHWESWENYNMINAYGSHPCFYLIPSADQTSLYFNGPSFEIAFPGVHNIDHYSPVGWDKKPMNTQISLITYANHACSFYLEKLTSKSVSGYVQDSNGNMLKGASVHVNPIESASTSAAGRGVLRTVRPASSITGYITETDDNGFYCIDLKDCTADEVEVSAYMSGYITASQTITLDAKGNLLSFRLKKAGEPLASDLQKWTGGTYYIPMGYGFADGEDFVRPIMGAVRFTQSELASHVGEKIRSLSFIPSCTSAEWLRVIIDFGSTRALTYLVPDPEYGDVLTVNIEDQNIVIPESGDVYFGYAVGNANDGQLGCFVANRARDSYYSNFDETSSYWQKMSSGGYYYDLVLSVTLLKEQETPGPVDPLDESLAGMGFASIGIPDGFEFTAGAELPLQLIPAKDKAPASVEWALDGVAVSSGSIILETGAHLLRATLRYEDGSWESIDLEFEI